MKYILLFLLLLPVSGFASDIDDERDRHNREQPLRNVDEDDNSPMCRFLANDFARARESLDFCSKHPIWGYDLAPKVCNFRLSLTRTPEGRMITRTSDQTLRGMNGPESGGRGTMPRCPDRRLSRGGMACA